jgi:hypothetical protein
MNPLASAFCALLLGSMGLCSGCAAAEKGEPARKYIVAAKVQDKPGPPAGCKIFPEDAIILAIYSRVHGPASYEECERWVKKNCRSEAGGQPKNPATPTPRRSARHWNPAEAFHSSFR